MTAAIKARLFRLRLTLALFGNVLFGYVCLMFWVYLIIMGIRAVF